MNKEVFVKQIIIYILIILAVFQSPLERIIGVASYLDEMVLLVAPIMIVVFWNRCKKVICGNWTILLVGMFLLSGILGNILFQYQKFGAVIQDIFTNLKFFCAIIVGYLICIKKERLSIYKEKVQILSKIITYFLFCFFIVDRIFNIFSSEIRYGIRAAQLFYEHPSYFAGALAFLLSLLMLTFSKNNIYAVLMNLFMMFFTLRSKAMASALFFCILFYLLIIRKKRRIKKWQWFAIVAAAVLVAWRQIKFYFINARGVSARSILLLTSLRITKDYFPIGTGFGTFASHVAAINYSPVYIKYGFNALYEVSKVNPNAYLEDMFWPIIFGQNGFVGTIAYILILFSIMKKCLEIKKEHRYLYMVTVFIMGYLLISSIAEPIFNNLIAIPLGIILGVALRLDSDKRKNKQGELNRWSL